MADDFNSTLLVLVIILVGAVAFAYVQLNKDGWKDEGIRACDASLHDWSYDYNTLVLKYNELINESKVQREQYNELVLTYNHMLSYYNPDKHQLENLSLDKSDFGPLGVYYGGQFLCWWAKDQTLSEQQDTMFHEEAHGYVFENPQHFCGNYCNGTVIV